MAESGAVQNPLISSKGPEIALTIHLHPLVLLTISDYTTRHTLRRQPGPIVGAVIGQQNGRSITLEHAYECLLDTKSTVSSPQLDQAFFQERLEQYKEVHKSPQLDLVAIFMLGSSSGPQREHLPIVQQVRSLVGSDTVLLLLFHPDQVEQQTGGKLPLSLYEPLDAHGETAGHLKFVERSFEVETGEAEMIGVDFVAKGGGNATVVPGSKYDTDDSASQRSRGKGKSKLDDTDITSNSGAPSNDTLSQEDEELVSALTARANAVRMLSQRLKLIHAYLASLPASSLTDARMTDPPPIDTNLALIRNINAMLSRLPLLAAPLSTSADQNTQARSLDHAATNQEQDVQLTSLLATLTQSVADAQILGSRFSDAQRERTSKDRYDSSSLKGGSTGLAEAMDNSRL